jgi:SagB-type dehydrogenase family enzyme
VLQPNPSVASKVQQIVETTLGIQLPCADSNLVALGASSMELVRVINSLEDEFGMRLDFADVAESPTVESLARVLIKRRENGDESQKSAAAVRPAASIENVSIVESLQTSFYERQAHLSSRPLASGRSLAHAFGSSRPVRSERDYANRALTADQLGGLLACLRQEERDEGCRALYGSAGATFGVQTFLYLKAGAVNDFAPGLYYYHPAKHELLHLAPLLVISGASYEPVVNAPMFERAGFAIFLVSEPSRVEPSYQRLARDYCLIEAGSIAQLLRQAAALHSIGLCQIGELKFQAIRNWFELAPDQECLHSFVGGAAHDERA